MLISYGSFLQISQINHVTYICIFNYINVKYKLNNKIYLLSIFLFEPEYSSSCHDNT